MTTAAAAAAAVRRDRLQKLQTQVQRKARTTPAMSPTIKAPKPIKYISYLSI